MFNRGWRTAFLVTALAAGEGCGKASPAPGGPASPGKNGEAATQSPREETPDEAYGRFLAAAEAGDVDAVMGFMTAATYAAQGVTFGKARDLALTGEPETIERMAKQTGMTVEELRSATGEAIARKFLRAQFTSLLQTAEGRRSIAAKKWAGCEMRDGKAYATTSRSSGGAVKEDWSVMVKEAGTWKFDQELTEKYKAEIRARKSK